MMVDCTQNIQCMLCYDLVSFVSGISLNNSMLSFCATVHSGKIGSYHTSKLVEQQVKLWKEKNKIFLTFQS